MRCGMKHDGVTVDDRCAEIFSKPNTVACSAGNIGGEQLRTVRTVAADNVKTARITACRKDDRFSMHFDAAAGHCQRFEINVHARFLGELHDSSVGDDGNPRDLCPSQQLSDHFASEGKPFFSAVFTHVAGARTCL